MASTTLVCKIHVAAPVTKQYSVRGIVFFNVHMRSLIALVLQSSTWLFRFLLSRAQTTTLIVLFNHSALVVKIVYHYRCTFRFILQPIQKVLRFFVNRLIWLFLNFATFIKGTKHNLCEKKHCQKKESSLHLTNWTFWRTVIFLFEQLLNCSPEGTSLELLKNSWPQANNCFQSLQTAQEILEVHYLGLVSKVSLFQDRKALEMSLHIAYYAIN